MSPYALLVCDSFSDFFVLMALKVLRNIGQVFCRMSLNLFFSTWLDELWILGRKTTEVKHRFHPIGSRFILSTGRIMLICITQLRRCLPGFSTGKFLFPLSTQKKVQTYKNVAKVRQHRVYMYNLYLGSPLFNILSHLLYHVLVPPSLSPAPSLPPLSISVSVSSYPLFS